MICHLPAALLERVSDVMTMVTSVLRRLQCIIETWEPSKSNGVLTIAFDVPQSILMPRETLDIAWKT